MDIKVGDVVHVRGVVDDAGSVYLRISLPRGANVGVTRSEIVHVEPRALTVGDTVKLAQRNVEQWRGQVLALHGDKAWVLTSPSNLEATYLIRDLVRA